MCATATMPIDDASVPPSRAGSLEPVAKVSLRKAVIAPTPTAQMIIAEATSPDAAVERNAKQPCINARVCGFVPYRPASRLRTPAVRFWRPNAGRFPIVRYAQDGPACLGSRIDRPSQRTTVANCGVRRSRPGFLNDGAHRNGTMPPRSRALLADGLLSPAEVLGQAFFECFARAPSRARRSLDNRQVTPWTSPGPGQHRSRLGAAR